MKKRYFRKDDPLCSPDDIRWIEMTGKEYYSFVTNPENQDRYFIDMGNCVLECTKAEARTHISEMNHQYYIKKQRVQEIMSLSALESTCDCNGEEVIADDLQDVFSIVSSSIEKQELLKILDYLDSPSYHLIYELYLSPNQKTERDIAAEYGVSQTTIHKRKKKILNQL